MILDKTLEMDQLLWIISLDLSQTFDRVNWESLWQAVGDHGLSQHLVWILQVFYYQHRGAIVGSMGNSFEFDIAVGVREGCVLSPRLFCSVLEWALSKWRAQLNGVGYNFQDGGVSLLDLRFADDILLVAKSYEEIGHVLDVLVDALRQVGLALNAGKTKKKLTTQSQHPAELVSAGGIVVEILERDRAHKWSMVNACTPQGEPILGTGGEKKYVHWFRMKFQIALTSGKKCRSLQKVHSSDDGISLPLAMVSNLCIDKKLGVDSPKCAVSFPRIGIGQMDSKQEFFAPGDVQVNLQCVMLISSAAYTHSMTKVAVQLFVRRFGPDHSSDAEFHAIRGTSRCLMAVLQLTDKVSEKGRQVYKVVSCTLYGDHLQNKPLLTRKH